MEYDKVIGKDWKSFAKFRCSQNSTHEIWAFEAKFTSGSSMPLWTPLNESPIWSQGKEWLHECTKLSGYGETMEFSSEGIQLWAKCKETEITSRFPFVFMGGEAYSESMFEIYITDVPSLFAFVKVMAPFACLTYASILDHIGLNQCREKNRRND